MGIWNWLRTNSLADTLIGGALVVGLAAVLGIMAVGCCMWIWDVVS